MNWLFFLKSNFYSVKVNNLNTEIVKGCTSLKKVHYSVYIRFTILQFSLIFISNFILKGYSFSFYFNNFFISNYSIYVVQIIIIIFLLILTTFNSLVNNNINYNVDFFFSISNIMIFLNLIYFSNNLLSTIFLLELNSITLFYMFVCSKYWYKINNNLDKFSYDTVAKNVTKSYLNMLFFQYWSTFFSSILLFFSLANIYCMYGSSDYAFLNTVIAITNVSDLNLYNYFVWLPFLVGFFIKLGITPVHLFKLEVYKGLPLISLLIYTTLYFFIYFSFFLIILNVQLDSIKIYFNSISYVLIPIGILYVISLIFDLNALKSFFAYSTIINGILFLIANFLN